MKPDLPKIPPEMKDRPQWVCYRHDKTPVNPRTGGNAMADNPDTWGALAEAIKHYEKHKDNGIAGIGYEFSYYDCLCGIDLDHCRHPETKEITPWAWEIIKRFNSYAEVSPSGTGVHIIIKAKFPKGAEDHQKNLDAGGKIEVYDVGRYFTVTGHHLEGTPATIQDRDKELKTFHAKVIAKPKTPAKTPGPSPTLSLADSEIIEKFRSAKNGGKFDRLWRGDISEYGGDESRADLAFCSMVGFYTQDPEQIDRFYRASALNRDKWDRPTAGSTYGAKTISKALAGITETYKGPWSKPQAAPAWQPQTSAPSKIAPGQKSPKPLPPQAVVSQAKGAPAICFVSGKELEAIEFKEPAWIVPGILPEGLCLLSARPKKGKTWWSLSVSVARSVGGYALGRPDLRLEQGKVLYLCLEDKLRRAQKRLKMIRGDSPFPEDLILAESWPRLDRGGLDALGDFLKENDDCKLVVVDSYAKIKPPRPKTVEPYDFDMNVGGALQALAQERQICLLLIYHNRKAEAKDPMDDVIGSTGLTGAVDAVLVLRRGRGQADGTLFITGRDVEEQELAFKFHPGEGLWELIGNASEAAISQERQEILSILRNVGSKTPTQLAKIINKSRDSVKMLLSRMKDAGLVKANDKGEYLSL